MRVRWQLIGIAYLLLAVAGGCLAYWVNDASPLWHPRPAIVLSPWLRETLSCAVGLSLAGATTLATRLLVTRAAWARRLHEELRPVAVGMSLPAIVAVASLSSVGEELFFRGFLTPWIGVLGQAVLFGVAHQIGGSSRWWWMSWAASAGLGLGALFWAFGTLSGPIVAHAVINAVNLAFLRDHDPVSRPLYLGGLLRT